MSLIACQFFIMRCTPVVGGRIASLKGDLDVDGRLTGLDLVRFCRLLQSDESGTGADRLLADVDGDGFFTVADLVRRS